MITDYSNVKNISIPLSLVRFLEKHIEFLIDDVIESKSQIVEVNQPFILADNAYDLDDLDDLNNYLEEINVKRKDIVQFTGGVFYIIYEKLDPTTESYIIHGNTSEGFNIFNLK